ncbi:MAG: MFS transporter [Desmonostoc vinosum HA7617-LM4]|jgi:EmrB/QacA subfamily drug resistance transporter|nr:MFS transporter [Desmonostoc vinosum HA7617-LM4]
MDRSRIKAITLTAMCFALFIAIIDDTVLNVALPQIQTSLGSNVSGLQWILNAYTLPAASLVLTSGTLGDIYGRKRVFLTGLLIFMIASIVCGLAPNLSILLTGRVLQGIGAAALIPTSLSIITDTFPEPREKTNAIAIWSAVSGLALIAGPVLGGLLVDVFGWQSTFFVNIPFGVIAFAITSRFVKEVKNLKRQNIDLPGLVLSIIFLASLTYALIESNTGVWRSPLIFWSLTIAGLSFLAFLLVESHSSQPMLPLRLFKNPTFAVVNVVNVLVLFTFVSLLFIFSLFLQQVQGYSAVAAGVRFLPMNGSFVIALLVSGWLANKLGWRFTIAAGLILACVATLSFIHISADTEYGAFLWKLVLSGFGAGLVVPPLGAAAMSSAPSTQSGIASAVLNTSSRLGGVLGIALQGTILTQRLASDLKRSLSAWGLPSNLQDRLITDALHGGIKVPSDLPINISTQAMHQAISNAFVSGLHTTVVVGSIALLGGALLILAFVKPTFSQISKNSVT